LEQSSHVIFESAILAVYWTDMAKPARIASITAKIRTRYLLK